MSLAALPDLPAYVPSPTQVDLTDSLGAVLIGTMIAQTLTGVSVYQTWFYYKNFSKDSWQMQTLVYGAAFLNFLHSALLPKCVYFWFVTHWGNLVGLDFVDWSYNINLLLNGILATVVQLFFAWRVYTLGSRTIKWVGMLVAGVIILISVFQLAWAIASTIMAFRLVRQSSFGSFTYGVWCWQAGAAAADVVITIALVYLLRTNKTAFKRTQSVIDKLVVITIETNMLTAILAFIVAVQFGTIRNGWPNGVNFVCVRLYHISLMVNVNSRHDLMEQLAGSRSFQMTPSPAVKKYGLSKPGNGSTGAIEDSGFAMSAGRRRNDPIQVTVTTQHDRDGTVGASPYDIERSDVDESVKAQALDSEDEFEKYSNRV
ncbi:hypothetical protein DACRYDRAFT_24557 [Dacryopinax primogenitus]|uniref:DUF6534 domain-containing protein n=1 Tax=Dacryopinax primogenitus (strain DJM 731) TaxID=1858805 RepID=M5FS04_DACPD|nr:uncharacterized protein DACRYDRAFT_24557 [Dacryopinax primogenitus]EJT98553.1 hypothetical protein DACRYDRAFT_24557 [Dacryopinax primogenitus]